jgi:ATP-dependent DNA helicase DinG
VPSARELLGPDGPLVRALGAYEHRGAQLAMADAVERALAESRVLLCEAGTGTGKTLAYLVPAALSGRRVVISTATKALQEQLLHKDLPLLERILGWAPRVAVAKGLSNYVCLRRYHELRATDRAARSSLPMLEAWVKRTESGDIAEATDLGESDPIWSDVVSSSDTRVGPRCEFHEACFVTRMKREVASADIVIANHHLFFADLAVKAKAGEAGAMRAGVLPTYDAVIFDEAHRLEDIATSFFGAQVSTSKIAAFCRDAERAFVGAGLGDARLSRGDGLALLRELVAASEELFGIARASVASPEGRSMLEPGSLGREGDAAWRRVDDALEAVEGFAETQATDDAVDVVRRRAASLRDELARILEPPTHQVAWIEQRAKSTVLGASAVDVGPQLRDVLLSRAGGVVLTSATLASAPVKTKGLPLDVPEVQPGPFSFVRSRLGLDADLAVPVDELCLPSPFDFERRAMLYLPTDLPEPSEASFIARAVERTAELVEITGGGAFVLSTSLRVMRALAEGLVRRGGSHVLVQGEAPKSSLLERFRAHGDAVLVATSSFWEGVDVPGEALRLVVIDKLPFAVPSDAVVKARCAALEARGQSAFTSYLVPDAAIALKQGFGRLLRTANDRGIVAILDRRIRTRGYGKTLLASLPPARRSEQLDEVKSFWAERRALP